MISSKVRAKIESVPNPTMPQVYAMILLREIQDGRYTATLAYASISNAGRQSSKFWKVIWRASVPEKVHFFLWLIGKSLLPTHLRIQRFNLGANAMCNRCDAHIENLNRILFEPENLMRVSFGLCVESR